MYFYFLIAWSITNWKFCYALLNTDEKFVFETKELFKPEYLSTYYSFDLWLPLLISISKLIIIPAILAFAFVWWLSIISEKFYEKNEQHKQNKRIIKRKLEYQEKISEATEQRKIRDAESDKPKIQYEDYDAFNESLDVANNETIEVSGISMRPSRVLYDTDYEAYKASLDEWINNGVEAYFENESDRKRGK